MMEHWVLLSSRVTKNNTRKQTDREQKAWGLIRTATGIVAKLISQRKLGSTPYLLAPEKPIYQQTHKVNSHGTGCLTLTCMIAELSLFSLDLWSRQFICIIVLKQLFNSENVVTPQSSKQAKPHKGINTQRVLSANGNLCFIPTIIIYFI